MNSCRAAVGQWRSDHLCARRSPKCSDKKSATDPGGFMPRARIRCTTTYGVVDGAVECRAASLHSYFLQFVAGSRCFRRRDVWLTTRYRRLLFVDWARHDGVRQEKFGAHVLRQMEKRSPLLSTSLSSPDGTTSCFTSRLVAHASATCTDTRAQRNTRSSRQTARRSCPAVLTARLTYGPSTRDSPCAFFIKKTRGLT